MTKIIVRFLLWILRWNVDTDIPKEAQRSVVIAAPHTSNWDGIYMRLAFTVLGIPMKFAIKDFYTKFPFGLLTKPMGGLGINRKPKKTGEKRTSQTQQMADFFDTHQRLALVIAPEGTRSHKEEWRMGFYHIAKMANVPITYGYLDYDKRIAGVGGTIYPSDDIEADMAIIMDFYKNITPKVKENYSLDKRYT